MEIPIWFIVWMVLGFTWLVVDTDYLGFKTTKEVYVMRLPSGAKITQADLDYLKTMLISPKTVKRHDKDTPCWYCGNGEARQLVGDGLFSYELCDCGASIVPLLSKPGLKRQRYAKLAKEVATIIAHNYNPTMARQLKTKRMIE